MPPIASCKNNNDTLVTVAGSPEKAMLNRVTKITRPKPSLNNDSPSICVEIRFGASSFFTKAHTAIGSVGDINEPNSKQ